MRAVVLVLALLIAGQAVRADSVVEMKSGAFSVQIDVRGQANLIYHLDCIARVGTCTSDVFEDLWRDRLNLSPDDRKLLNEWASLRKDIERSEDSIERKLPVRASVPIHGMRDDGTWSKIRYAEFAASDAAELVRSWSPLMPAETAARLLTIMDHFRPRFQSWWDEHEREAGTFLSGAEAAMRKARAAELLGAAARFYRSDLGDRRIFLHLFVQPKMERRRSRATLIGAHLVVEIEPNERAESRAPVIVHELAHHLFACMPVKEKARFAEAMLQSGPAGVAAWNLFDEVQATVIGNMLAGRNVRTPEQFKRMLDTPQAFYADDAIDRGARATEAVFADALKKGRAMRPRFAKDFVAALQAGMGDALETPILRLRRMALHVDDDASPWVASLRRVIRPSSTSTITPLGSDDLPERLDRYPGLSVVVLAGADQVSKLQPVSRSLGVTTDALTAALGASRGLVFVSQRTPIAHSFVFIARDSAAMEGMIAAFGVCQLKAGVCMRVE